MANASATDDVPELDRAALVARCTALLDLLPANSVFSHLTAARLLGLPLSYAMEEDARLHVIRPISCSRIKQPGVVGHRALHHREVVMVDGLPVVSMADTWVDLGELIGRGRPVGLDDLIVLGDAVASRLGSVIPMRAALAKRVRPRGKRTHLEGLELIRVGSASPGETVTRIMLVRVGLPEPELNIPIFHSQQPSMLLGIADFGWRVKLADGTEIWVLGEYQGREFHSSPSQRRHDRIRRRGFMDDGCRVEWVWNEDLLSLDARRATCLRFAAAMELPRESLDLCACEPRFFAQHRLDEAARRDSQWRMRSA